MAGPGGLDEWVGAHTRMVEYFGGSTELWVPDQLKGAVTRSCRYEPGLNRTYQELAEHYSTGLACQEQGKHDEAKTLLRAGAPAVRGRLRNLYAGVFLRRGDTSTKDRFRERHGQTPSDFLVISPGRAATCPAKAATPTPETTWEKLVWPVFERIVSEAHRERRALFFVMLRERSRGVSPLVGGRSGGRTREESRSVEPYRTHHFLLCSGGILAMIAKVNQSPPRRFSVWRSWIHSNCSSRGRVGSNT